MLTRIDHKEPVQVFLAVEGKVWAVGVGGVVGERWAARSGGWGAKSAIERGKLDNQFSLANPLAGQARD